MSSPRLPPEILHAITTSYLSPTNDASTLHALSLTHSFLLPATRASLFHTIRLARHVLDDGVHPFLCRSLATLFHRSPYIAGYVHKLIIVEGTIRNSWFSNIRYWVNSEVDDLPFILRMVAYGGERNSVQWAGIGLRSLEILGFGKSTLDWNTLHWQMRQTLVDVFRRGRLEDLRLVGFHNFPLCVLQRTQYLKNMCFGWLWVAQHTSEPDTESEDSDTSRSIINLRRPVLKFLDLSFEQNESQGTALIEELIQPSRFIDISRLEHLVINGDQHLNLQRLLDYCKNDLRFLEIRTNEYPAPVPPTHISLQSLSSLHCLSLFVPVIDWEEISPKPFPWLDHILSTLCVPGPFGKVASNSHLHTLQLIFDIDQLLLFERIEQEEWSNLNAHFMRLLRCRTSYLSTEDHYSYTPLPYTPHTQDLINAAAATPDLEIMILIFTDLDSADSLDCVHDISVSHTFLRDPLASYATTSCQCNDSSRGNRKGMKNSHRDARQTESMQMRLFLSTFLPVLSTEQGLSSIRIYRVNYIPKL